MKTVERYCCAGLSLAALARHGGAAGAALPRGPLATRTVVDVPLPGGYSPSEGSPPVAATSGLGSSRWSSLRTRAPQQPWRIVRAGDEMRDEEVQGCIARRGKQRGCAACRTGVSDPPL